MKLKDLKTGMLLEFRNGEKYILFNDTLIGKDGWFNLNYLNNNLDHMNNLYEFDVVKVSEIVNGDDLYDIMDSPQNTLWERNEIQEYKVGLEDGFEKIVISDKYIKPKCALNYKGIPFIITRNGKKYIQDGDLIQNIGGRKSLFQKMNNII